jgi:5-methylthioadenosine/S-adenosylhomocysteine deaminase
MARLRIENALLLTRADAPVVLDGVLEAVDGTITYAGAAAASPSPQRGTEIIDAGCCLLLPGLVNAHTHLAMTLFRGYADDMRLQPWLEEKIWPVEAKLQEEDVYWGSLLGVVEMLRAGITCFNDMYHFFEAGTRAALDGGIRAVPSGVLLGFVGDPLDNLKRAVQFTVDLRASGQTRVTPMLGPHAPYTCSPELLQKVAEQAREHDLGIHIHLSETQHEVDESLAQHGKTPVQHLADLGVLDCRVAAAHCVHLSDEDIAILAEKRVGCVHCPGSNLKLGSGLAPVPAMLAAGVTVALGTDGAASNNNLDLLEEARLAALLPKGFSGDPTVVPAPAALDMATRQGAIALGLDDRIGTLEVGKRADCVLLDLAGAHNQPLFDVVSQVIYAARADDVRTVVVDGEVVLRDRQFTRLDEAKIIAEASARAHRLTGA